MVTRTWLLGPPSTMNGDPGDMVIELVVETPVNLTTRQRELLREFEKLSERVKARGYQIHAVELGGKPIDFVADVDGDGKVGASDVAAVLTHWGEPGGPYDVTRDGLVDAKDLSAVLAGWNA